MALSGNAYGKQVDGIAYIQPGNCPASHSNW